MEHDPSRRRALKFGAKLLAVGSTFGAGTWFKEKIEEDQKEAFDKAVALEQRIQDLYEQLRPMTDEKEIRTVEQQIALLRDEQQKLK